MKIALVSLDQKWEDKAANSKSCRDLVSRAAEYGADMVVFPEMTLTGFSLDAARIVEKPESSPTLSLFSEIARKHRISLVGGVVLLVDERPANVLVAFSGEGVEQARYIKVHPFSPAGENKIYISGEKIASMKTPEFLLGFSICYDLRFPELYCALAKNCEILINIANWPESRSQHWEALLKARAIENQVFVIGVNRTGTDGNGNFYTRSSMAVDANGVEIQPVFSDEELDIVELDAEDLRNFRKKFSTRQDRRQDLYRTFT